jgi:hypothetical protein
MRVKFKGVPLCTYHSKPHQSLPLTRFFRILKSAVMAGTPLQWLRPFFSL